jgi:mono/diheme cytochrome c family protein
MFKFLKTKPEKITLKWLFFVLTAGLVLIVLSGCAGSLASDVTPPPDYQPTPLISTVNPSKAVEIFPLLPPDPSAGKTIYGEKCAPCHGDSGMGDGAQTANFKGLLPSLGTLDYSRKVSPATWFQTVTQGNIEKFMPGFSASLSDRQRWDVVAYLLTLSTSADQVGSGKQLYLENCQTCHGENATGITGKVPALDSASMLQKSLDDLTLIISQGKGNMPAAGKQLDEMQQLDTAIYIRSLAFASQTISSLQVTPSPVTKVDSAATSEKTLPADIGLVIAGKVINGSGFTLPPDLQVELTGYDSMQAAYTDLQKIGLDGSFSFPNVPRKDGRVYLISATYKGVIFTSDMINPGQTNDQQTQIITVYETSTDTSPIRADRLHLFFEFLKPDVVQVVQMFVINNPTDYLITAGKAGDPVISFSLPEGATNLQFQGGQMGERFILTPGGFGDTQGIPPGSGTQILFAYDLPYKTDLHLLVKVPLPVETSNIMLPSRGITIKSSQLQDMGEKSIQDTVWRIYSSGMIPAGTVLDLLLTGKPMVEKTAEVEQGMNLTVGLIALGLVLIVAAVLGFRWNSSRKAVLPVKTIPPLDGTSADAILDTIIALDDQFQAGQIPRTAYEERRAELKERLRGVK